MRPDDLEPMSPGMKALLEAERPLDVVPAATRAKLFAKVSASMAGAVAAGTVGSAAVGGGKAAVTSAAVGSATAGTAVASKVILAAAVAFTVGGGVGAGVHAVVAPPKQVVQPAPIVIRVEPARPPEPALVPEPPAAPAPAPAPARPAPAPAAPPPKKSDNLGAERSYIEQARAALSRHEAAAALSALAEHEREYPTGQRAEERIALQVIALSESGEAARARSLASRFRASYPGSLLMPAVDAAAPP